MEAGLREAAEIADKLTAEPERAQRHCDELEERAAKEAELGRIREQLEAHSKKDKEARAAEARAREEASERAGEVRALKGQVERLVGSWPS